MRLEHVLDELHVAVTRRWWTQLFTAFTRCLLAFGFIPPSYKKIIHEPFTTLPDSNPVGHYFNALMATGFYYEFIGWAQIIAAILLLIPRTSHIGAMMFLPIIVNIAVLTSSVGFQGTWILTIFMSLASLYLVAWEYDRLKPIIFDSREDRPRKFKYQWVAIPLVFAFGSLLLSGTAYLLRIGNLQNYPVIALIFMAASFVFGVVVAIQYRFMPVGHLKPPEPEHTG